MKDVRIYLGDLTHDSITLSSEFFPLNIGYVAAYAKKHYSDQVHIRLFKYIQDLETAIANDPPDILGLGNYPWCHNINIAVLEALARRKPEAIRIMGGPNFPHDYPSQQVFMLQRPLLDAYVYLDGEVGFANIIGAMVESRDLCEARERMRVDSLPGCVQRNASGVMVGSSVKTRIANLDEVPSPYLTGLLDQFFDGRLTPLMATNRGCPFLCTFCADGTTAVNKVNRFSLERVEAELNYIAERVPKNITNIFLADLNFGMYQRDLEISERIEEVYSRTGYPSYIKVSTGKNAKARVISAIQKLNGKMRLGMSVQSMTEEVLINIKRKNIRLSDYMELLPTIKQYGIPTASETILPMPGETLESHLSSVEQLLNADIDDVFSYTLMMINGAEMNTPEERRKWGFQTKFRILPRNFSRLFSGENIVEVEEVAVATNTFPFEDYLLARRVILVVNLVNNYGFRALRRFCLENGFSLVKLVRRMIVALEDPSSPWPAISDVLKGFSVETQSELWDSESELVEYYKRNENYGKLLTGEHGRNLLQTYQAIAISQAIDELVDCTFSNLRLMMAELGCGEKVLAQAEDIRRYCQGCSSNLFGPDRLGLCVEKELSHDVDFWLRDPGRPLLGAVECPTSRRFRFVLLRNQYENMESLLERFGRTTDGLTKAILRSAPKDVWRQCQVVDGNAESFGIMVHDTAVSPKWLQSE